jgi:hypothetical protein
MPSINDLRTQASNNTLIVPQGGYTVIKKKETKHTTILSPAVQTCMVVVLNSQDEIGFAHIDEAPKNGALAIQTMVREMRGSSNKDISVEVAGGDYMIHPTITLSSTHKAIYKALQKEKLAIKHTHWNIDTYCNPALIFLCGALLYYLNSEKTNPLFIPATLMTAVTVFILGLFLSPSHDVHVGVPSGKVTYAKGNEHRSRLLLKEAERTSPAMFKKIFERFAKAKGQQDLELIRVGEPRPKGG